MNNNYFTGMPTAIPVNGFCLASPELLMQIKEYFGLCADLSVLTVLQRYFAAEQRREPLSDELLLLDRYFTAEPSSPSRFALTALTSDDPRIGQTYDDLRAKAAELGCRLPMSLTELFALGQRCLSSVGLRVSRRERVLSGNDALPRLCATGYSSPVFISADGVRAALDISSDKANDAPSFTDCLVFVSGPEENFASALSSLMISGRGLFTVGEVALCGRGRLNALLSLAPGALIDLNVLPEIPLLTLAECSTSSAFLTLSPLTASGFVAEAGRFGLTARVCGRTDNFKRLTIVSGYGVPMTISTDFLRFAVPQFALNATVTRQTPALPADRGFDILTVDASGHSENVAVIAQRTLTAVGSRALSFDDVCLTLIEGVSRLVAAGADHKDITASSELRLGRPSDRALSDGAVGAILGAYRVQTELCLRMSGSRVEFGNAGLGAVMTAKLTTPLPDTLQSPGSYVYLLAPRRDEFGMPLFSDLRRLYEYYHGFVENGAVLSARAVGRAGSDSAINAFSGERRIAFSAERPSEVAVGALIVESKTELDGVFLGFSE